MPKPLIDNGRGVCRVCGRHFQLTRAGLVRHHLERKASWYRPPRCDGAGETPSHRPAPAAGEQQ